MIIAKMGNKWQPEDVKFNPEATRRERMISSLPPGPVVQRV